MTPRSRTKILPGETGLWVFIFIDLALFALYFVLSSIDRAAAPRIFEQGRSEVSSRLGLLNTLVLLSGSWAVAMGTRVVRDPARGAKFIQLAAASGLLFLLIKAAEWSALITAGHHIGENAFFTWYFFLTGFHALHVIGAVVFLLVLAGRWRRSEVCGPALVEAAGCYWHLVDLLWIGIFLMVYLL